MSNCEYFAFGCVQYVLVTDKDCQDYLLSSLKRFEKLFAAKGGGYTKMRGRPKVPAPPSIKVKAPIWRGWGHLDVAIYVSNQV